MDSEVGDRFYNSRGRLVEIVAADSIELPRSALLLDVIGYRFAEGSGRIFLLAASEIADRGWKRVESDG